MKTNSLADRALLSLTIQAVQEQQAEIEELKTLIK
jgi:hypothetical protein